MRCFLERYGLKFSLYGGLSPAFIHIYSHSGRSSLSRSDQLMCLCVLMCFVVCMNQHWNAGSLLRSSKNAGISVAKFIRGHLVVGLGHHTVHLSCGLNSYSSFNWIGSFASEGFVILGSVLRRISPSTHVALTFCLGFLRFVLFGLVATIIIPGIALVTSNGWPGLHCELIFGCLS